MNCKILYDELKSSLLNIYDIHEGETIANMILEKFGISRIDIVCNSDFDFSDEALRQIEEIKSRLLKFEPVQYVLGRVWFYDIEFFVNKSVLIPRRETEELVHWIIKDFEHRCVKILDIGTGSGCIPITLARHIKNAQLYAIDISLDAINVAQQNAKMNSANVNFIEADILCWQNLHLPESKFEVIVSNPPYVLESEKKEMKNNVLDFEPSLALFVDNNNPLIFYREIINFAKQYLSIGGCLYFEINEHFSDEICAMFVEQGFSNIEPRKDMQNRDRMVKAVWNGTK